MTASGEVLLIISNPLERGVFPCTARMLVRIILSTLTLVAFNPSAIFAKMSPAAPPKYRETKEELIQRFRLMPPQECENQFLLDYIAERSITQTEEGWRWSLWTPFFI